MPKARHGRGRKPPGRGEGWGEAGGARRAPARGARAGPARRGGAPGARPAARGKPSGH